ncbi:DUF5597 domain-containing protein [Paenarthrobacter nitroguajacolicus]
MQKLLEQKTPIPRLSGAPLRLFVDGEPFLVRGAELHNSTATHVPGIAAGVDSAVHLGANTVLAPVNWAQFEPDEGVYDHDIATSLIDQARAAGLRLIILWFGSYKNGASAYVPSWVKTNRDRFRRCVDANGKTMTTMSPFCLETAQADARAFRELMRIVEELDRDERTVIMVQVENETGILGTSRDWSGQADDAWAAPVDGFITELAVQGKLPMLPPFTGDASNWERAFGKNIRVEEAFMAAAMARYLECVAAAGRAETLLPFFTNTWLDSDIDLPGMQLAGGQFPGTYPTGGPLPQVAAIWETLAPSIDLITPDIYFGDLAKVCSDYLAAGGGLFVPEMRRDEHGAGDVMAIIGEHKAIGVAPFGVDSAEDHHIEHLRDVYTLIAAIEPLLKDNIDVHGFHLHDQNKRSAHDFGDIRLEVERVAPFMEESQGTRAYGIIAQVGNQEFFAAGRGFTARLLPDGADAEIVTIEEGQMVAGAWIPGRRINGDEAGDGSSIIHPPLVPRRSQHFPIPSAVSHTGLSRFFVHTFH